MTTKIGWWNALSRLSKTAPCVNSPGSIVPVVKWRMWKIDEGEQEEAPDLHGPRRKGPLDHRRSAPLGLGGAVARRELPHGDDVDDEAEQEDHPKGPQERRSSGPRARRSCADTRLYIDRLLGRSLERLEVPEHVGDDEEDKDRAGHGHDLLLAYGRVPELAEPRTPSWGGAALRRHRRGSAHPFKNLAAIGCAILNPKRVTAPKSLSVRGPCARCSG